MVGILQADEACPLRLAPLRPPLERHLQGHLDGGRSAIRVEDPAEARGRQRDQPFRQLDCGPVGQAKHCRVGYAPELRADRAVDLRMAMPVNVAPQRRDAVDVRVAVDVIQVGPLGAIDHERWLALAPGLLLGERMPEVAAVGGEELGGRAHPRRQLISAPGRNRSILRAAERSPRPPADRVRRDRPVAGCGRRPLPAARS